MTVDPVGLDDPRILKVFSTEPLFDDGARRIEGLIERNERVTQVAIYRLGLRRTRIVLFPRDGAGLGPVIAGALAGAKGSAGTWKKEAYVLEVRTAPTSAGPVLHLTRIDDGKQHRPISLYESEIPRACRRLRLDDRNEVTLAS